MAILSRVVIIGAVRFVGFLLITDHDIQNKAAEKVHWRSFGEIEQLQQQQQQRQIEMDQ